MPAKKAPQPRVPESYLNSALKQADRSLALADLRRSSTAHTHFGHLLENAYMAGRYGKALERRGTEWDGPEQRESKSGRADSDERQAIFVHTSVADEEAIEKLAHRLGEHELMVNRKPGNPFTPAEQAVLRKHLKQAYLMGHKS